MEGKENCSWIAFHRGYIISSIDFLNCTVCSNVSYETYKANRCVLYLPALGDGSIRLTEGTKGWVEVLYNGRWGIICADPFWSTTDGTVACVELGYGDDVVTINPSEE